MPIADNSSQPRSVATMSASIHKMTVADLQARAPLLNWTRVLQHRFLTDQPHHTTYAGRGGLCAGILGKHDSARARST
ncbi:hypothetical protein MRX96_033429 [Rhipicephalus microplus]